MIAARGYARVGLSVGVNNVRARALYERRGYKDVGLHPYLIRWPALDEQGHEVWEEEVCLSLVKDLKAVGEQRLE